MQKSVSYVAIFPYVAFPRLLSTYRYSPKLKIVWAGYVEEFWSSQNIACVVESEVLMTAID
jgi:hypothetical protein